MRHGDGVEKVAGKLLLACEDAAEALQPTDRASGVDGREFGRNESGLCNDSIDQ